MSRTIRLVLAAAFVSLAATSAMALPNTGAFNKSSEAFKLKMQQICTDLANEADDIENASYDSPIPPTKSGTSKAKHDAEQLREKGRAAGCRI